MTDWTEQEIAKFIYDQITSVASRQKSFNVEAATFARLDADQKIDFMNDVVFPAYEKAGSPAPRTEKCLAFTSNFFRN